MYDTEDFPKEFTFVIEKDDDEKKRPVHQKDDDEYSVSGFSDLSDNDVDDVGSNTPNCIGNLGNIEYQLDRIENHLVVLTKNKMVYDQRFTVGATIVFILLSYFSFV